MRNRIFKGWAWGCVAAISLMAVPADGQAAKGKISADDPPPALTYHGLVPGLDNLEKVLNVLGEPEKSSHWYNYKLYYPSKDRPGFYDIVHMHGDKPKSGFAEVEAASIPAGYETEKAIRTRLGEPEYEVRMATWKMLDYGTQGVRFSFTPNGKTTGVAYVPHLYRRVPEGERDLVDLTHLREGPQPAPASPASLAGLSVGISEIEISPTGEDWLPHKYTVHDPLMARIAIFNKDNLTVAFVGNDLFGMGHNEVMVIRKEAKKLGIDHTIFAMSHNHAAGDTIGVYGHYPVEYIAHIQQETVKGLKAAMDNMQPVGNIKVASKELPMDGIRVQGLFRNARSPGLLDPTISTLQVFDTSGKIITTVVHFACHVESLAEGAKEVSADFPGYMCDQMKKDGLGQPIFLNGAVGGMISGDNFARTHESARDMGLELAAIVKDLVQSGQPYESFSFYADQRRLYIPMTNPNFVARYESGMRTLERGRMTTDMTYIRLGETQFVAIPGELLPEVSYEVLEQMDGFPRLLVGLANDEIGYLVPPYDFRDDYYEESVSQGPAAATQVRDMALRMMADERKLRQRPEASHE